jgi:hypothetical protein
MLALSLTWCLSHAQTAVDSVAEGRRLAEMTIERMGGVDRWTETRYLVWENFGERHFWDKWTGDFRWEEDSLVAIMNINSKEGRFWVGGVEVEDPEEVESRLSQVYARWVNNSYWVIMPYKLLDPGVNLVYMGEQETNSGQMADVIEMTFEEVGLTPQNKYHVFIDQSTGMVCQWSHWTDRADPEPRFTLPWSEWKEYNGVMLSTGRGADWADIAFVDTPEKLPPGIFQDISY